jgi:hypothetical protein
VAGHYLKIGKKSGCARFHNHPIIAHPKEVSMRKVMWGALMLVMLLAAATASAAMGKGICPPPVASDEPCPDPEPPPNPPGE